MLDPSIDNTLVWTPHSGTNSSYNFSNGGYEEFQMQNNNSGGFSINYTAGPFAGTTEPFNQLTIPAGSLTPNQTYSVSINYSLASSASTTTGFAAAIYSTKTTFTAVASPTPAPTP